MNKLDVWRKHAIEAIVIVGSILLAFAIDAAWDSRKENIQEQQLLTFISADMERNINALNGVIEKNLERDSGLYNFMSATPESLSHLTLSTSRDFLQISVAALDALYAVSTFTPYQGSLVDSDLSDISNIQLRNELGAWLGLSDRVTKTEARNIEGSVTLIAVASKHGTAALESLALGLLPEILPEGHKSQGDVLSALRADEDFISSLLQYHNQRTATVRALGPLRDSTERVILLLQENM
ncbi:MAG: hypothetical protein COA96_06920 [SAR86 cluster bacterium]|uniref:Uncharacterized protein n=1 Tax=SAR86 cluster bacterium TaxID=2030880 RepID=A0A2A5B2N6_9GAMM|nr:MAG: hypothetical protein COA96_06920 [SAR86 cluster bacterium]